MGVSSIFVVCFFLWKVHYYSTSSLLSMSLAFFKTHIQMLEVLIKPMFKETSSPLFWGTSQNEE